MEIVTTRFGRLSIDGSDVLVFPAGLIGFETCRRWVLLSDPTNEAVAWLQCLDRPETAFAVVSPRRFVAQRRLRVAKQELAALGLSDLGRAEVLVIVSKGGDGLTMNLKAPIVLNVAKRLGCQAVGNGDESVCESLAAPRQPARRSA